MAIHLVRHYEAHGSVNGALCKSRLPLPYFIDTESGIRCIFNSTDAGDKAKKLMYSKEDHAKKVDSFLCDDNRNNRFYRIFRDFGASHEKAVSLVWGDS